VVDDEDRENEGDLLIAAECVTREHINFMASRGRGLICLTLTEERCRQLDLPLMVSRNDARFSTNFTVSIEAAEGVTTGISAQDRATTIRAAVKRNATADDIVMPGHIFPIKAQPGGVLTRAGHTEAGVDLARLSGFEPASVICEILKEDGSMARLPDLMEYGRTHGIRMGTIADLIRFRMEHDPTVARIADNRITTEHGEFRACVYEDKMGGDVHLALSRGDILKETPTLVRVHVHCGLFDTLTMPAASVTWTIDRVLKAIKQAGSGVLVMLNYNERPEELANRIARLNDPGLRNGAADDAVGGELRMLGAGSQILADLGVGKVLALGREKKVHGLSGFGLEIVEYLSDPEQLEN
ncbi:MAG: 3,4-dihydroxy-2-butanone-4-phosphate synthase, partial [Pseudomonadota bacterium]|nr:3,4-dihydroxy-2-butanone-4-phosphate synthase [Pseudomonadota bacterium]